MTQQRGKYIVFEGAGGGGKSTILKLMTEELLREGRQVVVTREPGGCPQAEEIRKQLLDINQLNQRSVEEEVMLFYKAREYNMMEVVVPALEAGAVVLKDRDYMSTIMFQGVRGVGRELLLGWHREWYEKLGFTRPDLRLVLVVNPEEAWRRRQGDGSKGDGFDELKKQFALDVATAYGAEMMDVVWGRGLFYRETRGINANMPIEEVLKEVRGEVKNCLESRVFAEGEIGNWRRGGIERGISL